MYRKNDLEATTMMEKTLFFLFWSLFQMSLMDWAEKIARGTLFSLLDGLYSCEISSAVQYICVYRENGPVLIFLFESEAFLFETHFVDLF
jgi:hypothetical protein